MRLDARVARQDAWTLSGRSWPKNQRPTGVGWDPEAGATARFGDDQHPRHREMDEELRLPRAAANAATVDLSVYPYVFRSRLTPTGNKDRRGTMDTGGSAHYFHDGECGP